MKTAARKAARPKPLSFSILLTIANTRCEAKEISPATLKGTSIRVCEIGWEVWGEWELGTPPKLLPGRPLSSVLKNWDRHLALHPFFVVKYLRCSEPVPFFDGPLAGRSARRRHAIGIGAKHHLGIDHPPRQADAAKGQRGDKEPIRADDAAYSDQRTQHDEHPPGQPVGLVAFWGG